MCFSIYVLGMVVLSFFLSVSQRLISTTVDNKFYSIPGPHILQLFLVHLEQSQISLRTSLDLLPVLGMLSHFVDQEAFETVD